MSYAGFGCDCEGQLWVQRFSAHTSACLLANWEPSAFRFCTMPSTLLELNSLKWGKTRGYPGISVPRVAFKAQQMIKNVNVPHQLWTHLSMSDRCFSRTNGFSESRGLCRQTGG